MYRGVDNRTLVRCSKCSNISSWARSARLRRQFLTVDYHSGPIFQVFSTRMDKRFDLICSGHHCPFYGLKICSQPKISYRLFYETLFKPSLSERASKLTSPENVYCGIELISFRSRRKTFKSLSSENISARSFILLPVRSSSVSGNLANHLGI